MIDDLFAFMRYERDWWRLQIYHEARQRHQSRSYRIYKRKQVVIQFLNDFVFLLKK